MDYSKFLYRFIADTAAYFSGQGDTDQLGKEIPQACDHDTGFIDV
jgi:hypothetical protein